MIIEERLAAIETEIKDLQVAYRELRSEIREALVQFRETHEEHSRTRTKVAVLEVQLNKIENEMKESKANLYKNVALFVSILSLAFGIIVKFI